MEAGIFNAAQACLLPVAEQPVGMTGKKLFCDLLGDAVFERLQLGW